jgi:hypothetical protein
MYFTDTDTAVASVHAFWLDMAPELPGDVTVQVESSGDILDDATGDLIDTWVSDPVDPVHCSGPGTYAAPAGACIDWLTATIANHRRLRGRTFLVPLIAADFDADGSLNDRVHTALKSFGDTLIAAQSASFVIWHRGTGTTGSSGLVTSCVVPDMAVILRSRRD